MRIKCLTAQNPLEEKIATLNESVTYYLLKSCVVYSKNTKDQPNLPIELPQTYSYLKFKLLDKEEQSNNETAANTNVAAQIGNNISTVRTNTESIDYDNTTTEEITITIQNTATEETTITIQNTQSQLRKVRVAKLTLRKNYRETTT